MRLAFALSILLGSMQSVQAADRLPIAARLDHRSILLLGWSHSAANLLVPRLVIDEGLRVLERQNQTFSLVIEWPENFPQDFYAADGAGPDMASLGRTLDILRQAGAAIVPGDAPELGRGEEVPDPIREEHFADVIELEYLKGRKVLLIVGSSHLLGISRALRRKGLKFDSVLTTYNTLTGEVRWRGRSLGFTRPDPRFADGYARFPKSRWDSIGFGPKIADPGNDFVYAAAQGLRRSAVTLFETCASFLKSP